MIYKYTKCESVIAKIMSDSNMSDKNIRITDMREWIFEAVEKIGAPMQYIQRESGHDGCPVFELHDRQIPIPDDLESLTSVAYSVGPDGPWIPARKDDMSFHKMQRHHTGPAHIGPLYDEANLAVNEPPYVTEEMPAPHPEMYHKHPTTKSQIYTSLGHANPDIVNLDERGYPLIPDLASYQEAIYWYVMMKLNFPKFLSGSLGGRAKYNFNTYMYLQQQWNFYRNQAYAEAMMPNEGEMRSIKNEWTKLIPDWDADDSFFYRSGKRQMNYNDYYYGS